MFSAATTPAPKISASHGCSTCSCWRVWWGSQRQALKHHHNWHALFGDVEVQRLWQLLGSKSLQSRFRQFMSSARMSTQGSQAKLALHQWEWPPTGTGGNSFQAILTAFFNPIYYIPVIPQSFEDFLTVLCDLRVTVIPMLYDILQWYYGSISQHSFCAYQIVTNVGVMTCHWSINWISWCHKSSTFLKCQDMCFYSPLPFQYTCTLNLRIAINGSQDSCSGHFTAWSEVHNLHESYNPKLVISSTVVNICAE